ncbi:MAG TPA: tetratricopeptide repeat protein, partial [Sphingobacteriaceae bacterium]|nr:tetratricopeptide repeat protein [Sphingobacteriaceae bacterium]
KLELTSEYKENYGFAVNNLMICYYHIGDMDETLKYAEYVKAYDRASDEEMANAHLHAGRVYQSRGSVADAKRELNLAALKSQTVVGAEARYLVGQLQFEAGELEPAMETAFDVINNMSGHDYWAARCFILLADIYTAKGESFQAKSTLESIIENYDGQDDIIPAARERLEQLNRQ